jgi:ubiquitin-conjugating enzyme E2 Q
VRLSPIVVQSKASSTDDPKLHPSTAPQRPYLNTSVPKRLTIYNQNFDELDDHMKAHSIVLLLETIPSITEMVTYLKQQKSVSEPSLETWSDRMSPAARSLLRWIIASNRSFIVQVDDDRSVMDSKRDQKVTNMSGWVQFRFAQGSPDKEHRFHQALEDTKERRKSNPCPTIFAWHGSGLQNWHSIIRSGLDFKETLHGRAFGHGCYHSLDHNTSLGYCSHDSIVSIVFTIFMAWSILKSAS